MTFQSRVNFAGVEFKNPVIAASGTFGYGREHERYYSPELLGGISTKGITLEPRKGNSGLRLEETPGGCMNSVGLENPSVQHYLDQELQDMKGIDTVIIANLSGSDIASYVEGAELIEAHNRKDGDLRKVDMIELNISCPNVKEGGIAFGITCAGAESVVKEVRKVVHSVPLVVKLSPNAQDIVDVAKSVEAEGADGISLINTFSAMAVDIKNRKAVFDNIYAGLSGPAIRPIALKMVREVARGVRIPVMGMGGIVDWEDAIAFIMVGASVIQFGTASFMNPNAGKDIVEGIEAYMKKEGITSLDEIRGII